MKELTQAAQFGMNALMIVGALLSWIALQPSDDLVANTASIIDAIRHVPEFALTDQMQKLLDRLPSSNNPAAPRSGNESLRELRSLTVAQVLSVANPDFLYQRRLANETADGAQFKQEVLKKMYARREDRSQTFPDFLLNGGRGDNFDSKTDDALEQRYRVQTHPALIVI